MVKKSIPVKTNFKELQPSTVKTGSMSGAPPIPRSILDKKRMPRKPDELFREILIFNQVYQERKNARLTNQVKELTFLRNFHELTIGGIHYLRDIEKKKSKVQGRPNNVPKRLLLLLTKDYFLKNECLPSKEWLKTTAIAFIEKYCVNKMELSNTKKSDRWTCSISSARDFLTWLKKQNTTGKPWNKKNFCAFAAQYE